MSRFWRARRLADRPPPLADRARLAGAAIAGVVYLPSLQDAGDETSLVGLVPEGRRVDRGEDRARPALLGARDHAHAGRAAERERALAGGAAASRSTREAIAIARTPS